MKKTQFQVNNFIYVANKIVQELSKDNLTSKAMIALNEVGQQINKQIEDKKESIKRLQYDFVITDPMTKAMLKDVNGNFAFTKEGQIAYEEAIKKFESQFTFEIKPSFVTNNDISTSISKDEIEYLYDFILEKTHIDKPEAEIIEYYVQK
jgi:hypothetical protein